jgi:hypothetical protein
MIPLGFWLKSKIRDFATDSQSFDLRRRFEGSRMVLVIFVTQKSYDARLRYSDSFEKSTSPDSQSSGLKRCLEASKCNPERQLQFCKWLLQSPAWRSQ